MNESLLHTIWKYKLYSTLQFVGTNNELIEVVSIGDHNQDSGPDFFSSKIKVNNILLVGNVEIHVKTSDWLKHHHQNDKAYDNLVLHVVYEHDIDLSQNMQFNVSVLELKNYINPNILERYKQMELSKSNIPCGKSITIVSDIVWKSWMDRLAISRLENKTNYIEQLFNFSHHNYEETLYLLLCRNFGFKINDESFEQLGKALPYSILKKYSDNIIQLEALLFGVAGFLDELFDDEYPKLLQNEFEFLKQKHQLKPIKKESWKFSKTRPVNFPTIRLSQLSNLIARQQSLYHLIEGKPSLHNLKEHFHIQTSDYWKTHFKFDKEIAPTDKLFGEKAFNTVLINTIIPFLFFSAKHSSNESFIEYSLRLLNQLPAESNTKTKKYKVLGVKTENALESQAQIQLYDTYCSKKACFKCSVGEFILKKAV